MQCVHWLIWNVTHGYFVNNFVGEKHNVEMFILVCYLPIPLWKIVSGINMFLKEIISPMFSGIIDEMNSLVWH
jgi:hypothetical protein